MMPTLVEQHYEFKGGYPTRETIRHAYDELDLIRATQMYRVFYPTVSGAAIFRGTANVGAVPNKVFGSMDTRPRHVGYTLNSDTPYGAVLLDLHIGPIVIELPPGPLVGAMMDIHQRWILDMGLPGADAGNGGKHVLLPPGHEGEVPSGYNAGTSASYRAIGAVRAIPQNGDVAAALELLTRVKVHPLHPSSDWTDPRWIDMTPMPQDTTPHAWEETLRYWQVLHDVVNSEPAVEDYREHYGELAAMGIAKGQPFAPDARMKRILEQAAQNACAQMRVESFADRRPDRIVWKDRQWEWAALRSENGTFDTPDYRDTYARDKWFFQAIAASPAMFRRGAGAGSLYWLGLRDKTGAYLDGTKTYKLTVPQPVPGKLFWSVTVYDTGTRSQIATDQGKAALRSMFELKNKMSEKSVDLYFGPKALIDHEGEWIKTIPGRGWFAYFRIYGPEQAAFDGSWKPGDFEQVGNFRIQS
jgi:hypothetical protein